MRLGAMFFGTDVDKSASRYDLLLRVAERLDRQGFAFVSTPERHFDSFGGLFPNPTVLSAALAARTERIQIRAGSVVLPLHSLPRLVEDWYLIDRLSAGRAAISFGSGWNVNDFMLAPDRFDERREITLDLIDDFRETWRRGSIEGPNGANKTVRVDLYPKPVSEQIPIWITASRSKETFANAGRRGLNILTHMENQDLDGLAERIEIYRQARAAHGYDAHDGIVTVMQHTFVSEDPAELGRAEVALRSYLARSLGLETRAVEGGGSMSGQRQIDGATLQDESSQHVLLDNAVEKYTSALSLIGPVSTCVQRIHRLEQAGANEVACLLDFIEDQDTIEAGLEGLELLNRTTAESNEQAQIKQAIDRFMGAGEQ